MYPTVLFGWKVPDLGILAWFHLVPLLSILPNYDLKKQFLLAFAAISLGYFGHLYWLLVAMQEYGGLGVFESTGVLILLILILAILKALFVAFGSWLNRMSRISLALTVPVFATFADFIIHQAPFNGFPWALPAYSQGQWLRFFQWVSFAGPFGMCLFIYLCNALIAEGWRYFAKNREFDKMIARFLMVFALGLLSLYLSFSSSQEFENNQVNVGEIRVALVQGNINQDEKWSRPLLKRNLREYERLTFESVRDGAELAIWPESAYPFRLYDFHLRRDTFMDNDQMPIPLFLGAVVAHKKPSGEIFLTNSVLHVDKEARFINRYDKMHLVPFGEYVPMKEWLTFASHLTQAVGTFSAGTKPVLFEVNNIRFGSLICYEDVFEDVARVASKHGAQVLINYTNDAWYGNTSAQYQHLVMSQFRALENRKPLLRATNTGYTAVINAKGEIIDEKMPFTTGYLLHRLEVLGMDSHFTQHGNSWMAWLGVVAILVLIYAFLRRNLGSKKRKVPHG